MDSYSPEDRENAGSGLPEHATARRILTVGQLNRAVAGLIERNLPQVWVAGEISNFTRAASGHWYFTLKDAQAQVRAVMFRMRAARVGFVPREGMKVEVSALASLYEARGEFQLNVELMRPAGDGDLYQRFLMLKEALQKEGLFEPGRKRPLPVWPARIGVITSPAGAALHDVLTTLRRRAAALEVIVYPTPVQGAEAPARIVAALRQAADRAECDVLLLVRGGGSIEDLWSFNDERVARAVAASPIPVVCGVGHETDFTIADFVADWRAPTPTGAAMAATQDRREWQQQVAALARHLSAAARRAMQQREQRLDMAARLLRPPAAQWQQRLHRLQTVSGRLQQAWARQRREDEHRLGRLGARLRLPDLRAERAALDGVDGRLQAWLDRSLQQRDDRLEQLALRLSLASPQQVLSRGYAIVRDEEGAVIRSAGQTEPGQPLQVMLSDGQIDVTRDA